MAIKKKKLTMGMGDVWYYITHSRLTIGYTIPELFLWLLTNILRHPQSADGVVRLWDKPVIFIWRWLPITTQPHLIRDAVLIFINPFTFIIYTKNYIIYAI